MIEIWTLKMLHDLEARPLLDNEAELKKKGVEYEIITCTHFLIFLPLYTQEVVVYKETWHEDVHSNELLENIHT